VVSDAEQREARGRERRGTRARAAFGQAGGRDATRLRTGLPRRPLANPLVSPLATYRTTRLLPTSQSRFPLPPQARRPRPVQPTSEEGIRARGQLVTLSRSGQTRRRVVVAHAPAFPNDTMKRGSYMASKRGTLSSSAETPPSTGGCRETPVMPSGLAACKAALGTQKSGSSRSEGDSKTGMQARSAKAARSLISRRCARPAAVRRSWLWAA